MMALKSEDKLVLPTTALPRVEVNAGQPGTESCILDARNDREAVMAWLSRFQNSPNTYSSYLKEADRFYRWSLVEADKPISLLTHEDFQRYQSFILDPKPISYWISDKKVSRSNVKWKPFFGPLSPSSARQTTLILDSLFAWLVESRYLAANPISLVAKRDTKARQKIMHRFMPTALISEVFDYMNEGCQISCYGEDEMAEIARCRWVFAALLLTGMRISELASASMADIRIETRDNTPSWWIGVIGKGNKFRSIPLPADFLDELKIYRESLGLNPIIGSGEKLPLVCSFIPAERKTHLHRTTLHRTSKKIAAAVVEYLISKNRVEEAEKFKGLSAHWLRHSYGTAMADSSADLRSIQVNLGHSSIQSTTIYLHAEDRMRHADVQRLSMSKGKR